MGTLAGVGGTCGGGSQSCFEWKVRSPEYNAGDEESPALPIPGPSCSVLGEPRDSLTAEQHHDPCHIDQIVVPPSCGDLFSGRRLSGECDQALQADSAIGPCSRYANNRIGVNTNQPVPIECRGHIIKWDGSCENSAEYELEGPSKDLIVKQADTAAQYHFGLDYEVGRCVPQDYVKAAYWYRKAAENNYPEAQNSLATLYESGLGVPQDFAQAVNLDHKVAESGMYAAFLDEARARSEFRLAISYYYGKGVPQDYAQAYLWFRKYDNEIGSIAVHLHLGDMYYYGQGVQQDYKKAAYWYHLAADPSSPQNTDRMRGYEPSPANAEAQTRLLELYGKGLAQPRDVWRPLGYTEANDPESPEDLIRLLGGLPPPGSAEAESLIGDFYERGFAVPQDYKKAASWYQQAAEQGNADAEYHIGYLYGVGQGVPQDITQKGYWYRKAADRGHADAQFYLGVQFEQGAPKDLSLAAYWYLKAAQQGHPLAIQSFRRLIAQAPSTRIATAAEVTASEVQQKSAPIPSPIAQAAHVSGTVVEVPADVMASMVLQKTAPVYSPIAKAARVSGTVVLHATISKTGLIKNLAVVSGPALLRQDAIDAVKTWRYKPYIVNNEPVEIETTVNVIFTLGG